MSQCQTCRYWITRRITTYEDGSTIENWVVPGGDYGHCDQLNMDTQPDFGCNKYEEGDAHEEVTIKKGAPWQNWHFGPCPDCKGVGCHMVEMRPACGHCAGLGYVRHYDDGYIADKSWDHPKEKAFKKEGITDPGLMLAHTKKRDEGLFEGGSL